MNKFKKKKNQQFRRKKTNSKRNLKYLSPCEIVSVTSQIWGFQGRKEEGNDKKKKKKEERRKKKEERRKKKEEKRKKNHNNINETSTDRNTQEKRLSAGQEKVGWNEFEIDARFLSSSVSYTCKYCITPRQVVYTFICIYTRYIYIAVYYYDV